MRHPALDGDQVALDKNCGEPLRIGGVRRKPDEDAEDEGRRVYVSERKVWRNLAPGLLGLIPRSPNARDRGQPSVF